MVHSFYKYPFIQASYIVFNVLIVTTFRGADIKVEVANFGAAMDTLIGQDGLCYDIINYVFFCFKLCYDIMSYVFSCFRLSYDIMYSFVLGCATTS